ncbi:MAG: toll/interleukin-1 receptor domain-containing protein, partial [Pseudomonadota bacterium]
MADVFISYARDNRDKAAMLADLITKQGYDVWWDRDLIAGDNYSDVIEETLDTATAVIVLWSGVSRKSHWVRDEAAVGRDRNRLLPIIIDANTPPLGFRQVHTLDMKDWTGGEHHELEDLWAGLKALCGPRATATPPPVQPHQPTSPPSAPTPDQTFEAPPLDSQPPQSPPPGAQANQAQSTGWQAPEWLAKPNDKSVAKILKEEKNQRSFLRTFWITSFVVSGIMAIALGALSVETASFDDGVIVSSVVAFVFVGFGLVIGRALIVFGRRLSKRKSTRYFDGPTLISLAISAAFSVAAGFSTVTEPGANLVDGVFLTPVTMAVVFPFFA